KELPANEIRDLLDRGLAREPRRLTMPSSLRLPRDRGDVQLVDAGAKADTPGRAVVPRGLADQHGHVGAFDGSKVVDDPLGVRLGRSDVREVRPQEIRDDDPAP